MIKRLSSLCLLFFCNLLMAYAQDNPWVLGLYTKSNNVYVDNLMKVGEVLVNSALSNVHDQALSYELMPYNYHYVKMENNDGEIDVKRNSAYGFTAYDLFNDFEVGLKAGWYAQGSPLGAFLYGTYGLNQYKYRFPDEQNYSRSQLQNIRVGVGLKIIPLVALLEDEGWSPLVEIKSSYIINFSYSGPKGNDLDQVKNGFRTSIAIGTIIGDDELMSVLLYMDMAHYNIFDNNYSADGGLTHPYSGFKSKDMNFGVRLNFHLFNL